MELAALLLFAATPRGVAAVSAVFGHIRAMRLLDRGGGAMAGAAAKVATRWAAP
jgi:hypothetical protein